MTPLDLVIIASIVGGLASGAVAALPRVGAPPLSEDGFVGRPEKLARARALRAAHGRRLGTILIVLGILIWPAWMILSAAAMTIGIGGGISLYPVLMVASATLLMRGRRMRAKDAKRVLEHDPRPPIVYLRPFEVDHANRGAIAPGSFRGRTAEQEMDRVLRDVAPFVALGDPTDDLPELGAVRLYADDIEWQKNVEELTNQAGTIILHAGGESDGLAWEVQHVVGLGQPERIVLVRGVKYDAFCSAFAGLFPRGLLKNATVTSQYFYFDADWMPHSFDEDSNIDKFHGSPGEQRGQVLRRLL